MRKLIEAIENRTISTYGFEHPVTCVVFRMTDLLRKL
jgi:hypothetical protein